MTAGAAGNRTQVRSCSPSDAFLPHLFIPRFSPIHSRKSPWQSASKRRSDASGPGFDSRARQSTFALRASQFTVELRGLARRLYSTELCGEARVRRQPIGATRDRFPGLSVGELPEPSSGLGIALCSRSLPEQLANRSMRVPNGWQKRQYRASNKRQLS